MSLRCQLLSSTTSHLQRPDGLLKRDRTRPLSAFRRAHSKGPLPAKEDVRPRGSAGRRQPSRAPVGSFTPASNPRQPKDAPVLSHNQPAATCAYSRLEGRASGARRQLRVPRLAGVNKTQCYDQDVPQVYGSQKLDESFTHCAEQVAARPIPSGSPTLRQQIGRDYECTRSDKYKGQFRLPLM